MGLLEPLYQRFKTLSYMDISSSQKFELRDGLMMVKPSEITSTQDAQRFMSLLRMLRESIIKDDELHGQNYPQLLNSLLSVGEDGLYSNNLRFVFELIQNVDDCEFADLNDHTLDIHFDFNHDKIVLRYNEKGFTPFNVFAITGIAETAKNIQAGKNEIGEKGIGFKSVFGVADAVLIRSGWFSFELYKENFTVPQETVEKIPVGQGMTVTLNGENIGLYRESGDKYYAVDTKCPHLGCRLEWNPDDLSWDCPCHGSRFDYTGKLLDNPAQTDIGTKSKVEIKSKAEV